MKRKKFFMVMVAVFAAGLAFATQKIDSWCEGEQQYVYRGGSYVEVTPDYICWLGTVDPVCTYYRTGANTYAPCHYGSYITGFNSAGSK